MSALWSASGAGHRPLELNLGRRGGGDPSATANTAKCVINDSYGRSLQQTTLPQIAFYNTPMEERRTFTRIQSEPIMAWPVNSERRPSTGSLASKRSASSSVARSGKQDKMRTQERKKWTSGRATVWQFPNEPHIHRSWQIPLPTNTIYGNFHLPRQTALWWCSGCSERWRLRSLCVVDRFRKSRVQRSVACDGAAKGTIAAVTIDWSASFCLPDMSNSQRSRSSRQVCKRKKSQNSVQLSAGKWERTFHLGNLTGHMFHQAESFYFDFAGAGTAPKDQKVLAWNRRKGRLTWDVDWHLWNANNRCAPKHLHLHCVYIYIHIF